MKKINLFSNIKKRLEFLNLLIAFYAKHYYFRNIDNL